MIRHSPPRKRARASDARQTPPGKKTGGEKKPSPARSGLPLYQQLVQTLKSEILAGVHPAGGQMPTESELAERFEVSRHTVRAALRQLRDDGLVSSRQGAGTTVLPPGSTQPYVQEVSSINDLVSFVSEVRYHIDATSLVVSDAKLVNRIGGVEGQRWARVEGFRYKPDNPVPACWTEVFIHSDFARVVRLLARSKGPIFELIEDMCGERIAEVEQHVRSRPIPKALADALQAEPGTPGIEVYRIFRLTDGKVAEVSFNLFRVDQFDFSMTLRRTRGAQR